MADQSGDVPLCPCGCGKPAATFALNLAVRFEKQRDILHHPAGELKFMCHCPKQHVLSVPSCYSALSTWKCPDCKLTLPSSVLAMAIAGANATRQELAKRLAVLQ